LRLGPIIRLINLTRPIATKTTSYKHFSRTDIQLPSEIPKQVEDLPSVEGNELTFFVIVTVPPEKI
jgi:S-adenosylmethionine synthetase